MADEIENNDIEVIDDVDLTKVEKKVDENLIDDKDYVIDNKIVETAETVDDRVSKKKPDAKKETPRSEGVESLLSVVTAHLHEKGILPSLNIEEFNKITDPIEQETALETAWAEEKNNAIGEYVDNLPSIIRQAIENYEDGLPADKALEISKKKFNILSITEDALLKDPALQKRILMQSYKDKGFSDEKATKFVNLAEVEETLFNESKDVLEESKANISKEEENEKKNAEQQRIIAEQRNKEIITTINNTLTSTKEIIPGMPLNDTIRKKVYESMTTVIGKDQKGNPIGKIMAIRAKDPIKFEITLNYLAELGVLEGDWSKVNKTLTTNATKSLAEKLSEKKLNGGKPLDKSFADDNILESIKNKFK